MKTKNEKPKMITTTFEKKFDSFKDPEFCVIFKYEEGNDSSANAAHDVLEYFGENFPNVEQGTKLPVSLSLTANRVNLKTDKFFSIGWMFKFNREGVISDLTARITTFTKAKNDDLLMIMIQHLENGWTKFEDK